MPSILPALASACLLIVASLAQAQDGDEHRYFRSKHVIGVGATYQDADAEIRASRTGLPEIALDLDTLGVDDTHTSWALEYRWRFSPKWMLVALAYTFDEDGGRTVERDFNFDGVEFQAGAAVDTSMAIDTYILDVLYRVHRSDRLEILVGGGLHAFDLDTSIEGRAFVGDRFRERASASSELLAPLPNLRAQVFYSLGGRWGLGGALGWLSANYDDYDGSFFYAHPRIGYWFGERWAATLGYQYVDIDLTYDKSSTKEIEFDASFTGPTFFLNYRF